MVGCPSRANATHPCRPAARRSQSPPSIEFASPAPQRESSRAPRASTTRHCGIDRVGANRSLGRGSIKSQRGPLSASGARLWSNRNAGPFAHVRAAPKRRPRRLALDDIVCLVLQASLGPARLQPGRAGWGGNYAARGTNEPGLSPLLCGRRSVHW